MPQDSLGPDQVGGGHGIWLEGNSARVLPCAGQPDAAQGRNGDVAWGKSANPPARFVRGAPRWDQTPAGQSAAGLVWLDAAGRSHEYR